MPPLLLGQPFAQAAHQFVETARALDGGAFLGCQQLFGQLFQPFGRDRDLIDQRLDRDVVEAGESLGEGAVEAVDMRLVLDQGGAGQVIEPLGRPIRQPGLKPGQKVQIFPQAGRHSVPAQTVEKRPEHQAIRLISTVRKMPSTARPSAWAAAYCIRSARLPPSLVARPQPIAAPRIRAAMTIMRPG